MTLLACLRKAFAQPRKPRRLATRRPTVEALEDRACPSGLDFSTYLGGNSNDNATCLAVDAAGNSYIAGDTLSANFPVTAGAVDTAYTPGRNSYTGRRCAG